MEWLNDNLLTAAALIGLLMSGLLWAAVKYLPDLIFNWFEARVQGMFEAGDAADDELLLADRKSVV